jgi:hypothetical protein
MHRRDESGKALKDEYFCTVCGNHLPGNEISWAGRVEYAHVPSVAMARYAKAFAKHDPTGFEQFKAQLKTGEKTVNAATLFPHDCLRTVKAGQAEIADRQFEAMPDYIGASERRIMALVDTSSSMNQSLAGGSVTAMEVAISLGLYCSDRVGPDNPFYRKYMEFSTHPSYIDWAGSSFSRTCRQRRGYIGSTNIQACLDYLLSTARTFGVSPDRMITTLLILSDMQFDSHTVDRGRYGSSQLACVGT